MKRPRQYAIAGQRQLEAVGSPIRQQILDSVIHHGPMTIAQLAARLGRPPAGLHHHVKALRRAGLLHKVGVTGAQGRPAAVIDTPARRMRIDMSDRSAPKRAALRRAARATLRLAERDYSRGLELPDTITEGRDRTLWVGRAEARLGAAELRKLNRALKEVVELLARPTKRGGRTIAVTWSVAPVPGDPGRTRRGRAASGGRGKRKERGGSA